MTDKIIMTGMPFYGFHGIFEHERELGQQFTVDLEITLNLNKAGQTDDLADTLDYVAVYHKIKEVVENRRFNLLETLAQRIADVVLAPPVTEVLVRVKKTVMPVPGQFHPVAVQIVRNLRSTEHAALR